MRIFDVLKNAVKKIDNNINVENITNREIDTLFGTASGTGTNAQDYVVEHGTSGIWTYRKWASGIAECWGVYTATISHYTTVNNFYGYYRDGNSGGSYYDSKLVFPFTFTTLQYYNYGGSIGAGFAVTASPSLGLSNSFGTIRFLSTIGNSQSVVARIYAKGTWK